MRRWGHLLRAAPTLLRVGWSEMVAYRAEVVIWFLTASLPLVMMLVWDRVAARGPVEGLDQATLARYFASALVVRQFTGVWIVWQLNTRIRNGALSGDLLKPIGPLWVHAAENLAAMPLRAVVLVPLLALVGWWRPTAFAPIGPGEALALPLSIALAWTLMWMVQVSIGSLAFRWRQSLGMWEVWFGAFMLLSGYMFPVAVVPARFQPIFAWLPFRAMLGVPVEIASGLRTGRDVISGLGSQAAWLVAATLVARATWRWGIRHHEAVGA